MKKDERHDRGTLKNLIDRVVKSPKIWGTAVAAVVLVTVTATVIAGAGYLKDGFNPDAYLQDKTNSNDVAYDSTVFGANQNNDDGKEMDENAQEDVNLDDGEDPVDEENQEPDDVIQLLDDTGDTGNSSDTGTTPNGIQGVSGDDGSTPVTIIGNPGTGTGNGNNNAGGGTPTPGGQGAPGSGTPTLTPTTTPATTTPQPTVTPATPDSEWAFTGISAVNKTDGKTVIVYRYTTLNEENLRGKMTVTASYQNRNDPSQTRTEVVTDYRIDGIPQNYVNKELTRADVGNDFDYTVTYQNSTQVLNCSIRNDYYEFERVSINYLNPLKFCVGDTLNSGVKTAIKENIDVTAYAYSHAGRVRKSVPDFQDSSDFDIQFHDSQGNLGGSNQGDTGNTIKAEKGVQTANILLHDETNKYTTLTDELKYSVYNYKLVIMYYDGTVLRTIYQDSPYFDLMTSSDGGQTPYNEMIQKMTDDGIYNSDDNGMVAEFFYGWSLYSNDTNYANALTKYTFGGQDHTITLYPLPLKKVSNEYQIRTEGNEQILVGYTGTADNLDVPYGVTKIQIDRNFNISSEASGNMKTITIPNTVRSIDFSGVAEKFPNLERYVANDSSIFRTDAVGALYTDSGATLLRLPVQTADTFEVPYSTVEGELSVSKIAEGALDDAVKHQQKIAANVLDSKVTGDLTLVLTSPEPPKFKLTDSSYGTQGGLKIQVPDWDGDKVKKDFYVKYYAASWGAMLDRVFDSTGFALKQVIFTPSGAQKDYENEGNTVYSRKADAKVLEFAPTDAASKYEVDGSVTAIAAYAFDKAPAVTLITIPDSVTELKSYSFATSEANNIAGIEIAGTQKIDIGSNVAGELPELEAGKTPIRFYVSAAQEEVSGWHETLVENYGEKETEQLLVEQGGTVEYLNDCVYVRDSQTKELTLYHVPAAFTSYSAPEGLTGIADNAFTGCPIKALVLPEVTEISKDAFAGCSQLEMLVLSSQDPVSINTKFEECTALQYILVYNAENVQAPQGVQILSDSRYTVWNNVLYEQVEDGNKVIYVPTDISGIVTLKDNTTVIGAEAFIDCKDFAGFSEAQWNTITTIEKSAFENCTSLATEIPAEEAESGTQEGTAVGTLKLTTADIGDYAFAGCTGITQLELNTGVTSLGEGAFEGCSSLAYIYWRADTTTVGDYLFENCPQIMYVNVGDETLDVENVPVTTIGNYTFQNCKRLLSVKLFTSIKDIGDYAFKDCSNVQVAINQYSDSTWSNEKMETIGDYAFEGCSMMNTTFNNSDQLVSYGEGCFKDCVALLDFTCPTNLKEIPNYCFMGCSGLKTVYAASAENNFTRIGTAAFSGCTNLQRVYRLELYTKMTEIGESAFSAFGLGQDSYGACTSLISIELPRNLVSIGNNAFEGDESLQTVDFSMAAALTSIGRSAFEGCIDLSEADLNVTEVTRLEERTFYGCESISTVVLPDMLLQVSAGALDGCSNLSVVLSRAPQMVQLESGAFGETGKNESLMIYIPYSNNHALKNRYVADEIWTAELDGRQESIIMELGDSIVMNGGIYKQDENGGFILDSVLSSNVGSFTIYKDTVKIEKDAFAGCSEITMVVMPDDIPSIPEGVFAECTNLELLVMQQMIDTDVVENFVPPTLEGDLFENGTRNPNFRIAVDEAMLSFYEGWYDAPIINYGFNYVIDSNVFYGQYHDEVTGAKYITMLYVPRSYSGHLDVYADAIYIGESAAEGCENLISVTVSIRTVSIDKRAFAKCSSLESIYIPNTTATRLTEIGEEAFMDCVSLVGRSSSYANRLTIPISIRKIGRAAFKNCTSLTYFSVQGTLTEIADETFEGCTALGTYMSTTAGFATVTRIGKKAFYGCTSITSLSWTNMTNLEEVDDSAYEGCSELFVATFADKLNRIGDRAFAGTNLLSISFNGATPPELGTEVMDASTQENIDIYVPLGNTGSAVLDNYQSSWSGAYPVLAGRIKGMNCSVFRMVSNVLYSVNPENARELTAIKVPSVLSAPTFYNASSLYCVAIADDALRGCNLVKTITLTANIHSIGARAFADCGSLSTVNMTNSALTEIGDQAFLNCTSIKSLNIPSTVSNMGAGVFDGVVNLENLTMSSTMPPSIGVKILGEVIPENLQITVPEASYAAYVERWTNQLDGDYGVGTTERILTYAGKPAVMAVMAEAAEAPTEVPDSDLDAGKIDSDNADADAGENSDITEGIDAAGNTDAANSSDAAGDMDVAEGADTSGDTDPAAGSDTAAGTGGDTTGTSSESTSEDKQGSSAETAAEDAASTQSESTAEDRSDVFASKSTES